MKGEVVSCRSPEGCVCCDLQVLLLPAVQLQLRQQLEEIIPVSQRSMPVRANLGQVWLQPAQKGQQDKTIGTTVQVLQLPSKYLSIWPLL